MLRIFIFLLHLSLLSELHARRGVWFTNVNSKIYDSKNNIEKALVIVKKLGFDTVYPVVWNKSKAFFKSKTIAELFGEEALSSYDGRDILQEFVELSEKHGLEVIPWFEYGLKVPYSMFEKGEEKILESAISLEKREMLSRDEAGKVKGPCEFGVCKAFLNPANPQVKDFLTGVFQDLSSYNVVGVQIDDHFSLHKDFGYDDFMKKQYSVEYPDMEDKPDRGLEILNLNAAFDSINEWDSKPKTSNPSFKEWRHTQVASLVKSISATVRSKGKIFVIAPGGDNDFSKNKWQQDWLGMSRQGAFDEIIVQVYRYSMSSFKATLNHPSLREAKLHQPVGVAVLTGLKKNTNVTGEAILKQTIEAEKQGYPVSYFYYDSIVPKAMNKESQSQRIKSLVKARNLFKEKSRLH